MARARVVKLAQGTNDAVATIGDDDRARLRAEVEHIDREIRNDPVEQARRPVRTPARCWPPSRARHRVRRAGCRPEIFFPLLHRARPRSETGKRRLDAICHGCDRVLEHGEPCRPLVLDIAETRRPFPGAIVRPVPHLYGLAFRSSDWTACPTTAASAAASRRSPARKVRRLPCRRVSQWRFCSTPLRL